MVYSLPYAVVAIGMALSWRFNRSKIFFILVVLALAYWSVGRIVAPGFMVPSPDISESFAQSVLCLLLPLNFLVFSSIKERGIFTFRGLMRLGLMLAQLLIVYVAWSYGREEAVSFMQYEFLPTSRFLQTGLSDLGVVIFVAAMLILIYRALTIRSSLDYGLIGSLLLATYALHTWNLEMLVWWVTAAAGVLVIALVQDAYRKAYVDELTGLPGRRSMEEYFLKLSGMYTVAMVDIDHFKKCNDRYGHDVGDQVLRMIASFLRNVERGGKPFRYGGEEFAIVFPGKDIDLVISALDILRQSIADNRFVVRSFFRPKSRPEKLPKRENQKRLAVTVSIGCAQRIQSDRLPADVIKRADKALYHAKETGRNRVCTA